MTRAQIQAVYDQGPDAVFALVERLLATIAQQQATLLQQQATIDALSARVKLLEDRLAKDSHNSSKPPSSDPPARKPKSLRSPSGKKPGGQPGHPGQTLRMVDHPQHTQVHAPEHCSGCGASLVDVAPCRTERRQVFDLPPMAWEVTEHQVQEKRCPGCGASCCGQFPAQVSQPVQYGPRLQAFLVYLLVYQLVPHQRLRELVGDLLGRGPSEGTVQNAVTRCFGALAKIEARIRQGILGAQCVGFDETGVRIGGKLHWYHVAATTILTYYQWHAKRGGEAMEAIGLLPGFSGRALHDGWSSYFRYGCLHALCNAHHLRELTWLEEREGQAWAGELKRLLLALLICVKRAREAGGATLEELVIEAGFAEYDRIVALGWAANPSPASEREEKQPVKGRKKESPARRMLSRLTQYREETLAFLKDLTVPFANNQAERDQRMVKVQQKISGGFRSEGGADSFCRIRSYIETARKQGQPVLGSLEEVFRGHPYVPYLSAPSA